MSQERREERREDRREQRREDSRREFLLKLAKGAVYSAPVVRTLAAPDGVAAQNSVSGKGEMKGQLNTSTTTNAVEPGFGPSAPWTRDP